MTDTGRAVFTETRSGRGRWAINYFDYVRFASRAVIRRGPPVYLVYFVTDRCNARCRHCLFGDGTVYPPAAGRELTVEEAEKVARSIGRLLFLLPTGGEPFLREDLPEIVAAFYRGARVRNVGIPTNGSLTARAADAAERILAACPEIDLGIDVSLDGVGELHDWIRGVPGLFDRAIATFRALARVAEGNPRLSVNVETTVSSFNDAHLDEIYAYAVRELRPDAIFTLLTRGNPRDPASLDFDIGRYLAYAERLERGLLTGEVGGYRRFPFADFINAKRILRHRLIERTVRERRRILPCLAGSLGGALFANGDVYPCELRTDLKIGNVREAGYDFMELWNGPRAREARSRIAREGCFCTYECFLTLNILFNPLLLPRILAQWLRIKGSRLAARRGTERGAE